VLLQEKEMALNMAINSFCELAKLHANLPQLVPMFVSNLYPSC